MSMSMPIIRIISNACITRYNRGERDIGDIVASYTALGAEDRELVCAEIFTKRPDLMPVVEGSA
ncbi:hypothetical protein BCM02_12332 [Paenibacillus methanolicus]|uniref:Uncharacterized protein n=1 Tax=Paenibacillus methanolicus TaxID=582686 RepID=A0A5S5BKV1_9BACL|nr:hypothetical protein BCM02_12332 [Paenibacillus methanolicus]